MQPRLLHMELSILTAMTLVNNFYYKRGCLRIVQIKCIRSSHIPVQKWSKCPSNCPRTTLVTGFHSKFTEIWRTSADMYGQVQTTLVPGCLIKLPKIWRTGADRCGELWFLGVSWLADIWRTDGVQVIWRTFGGHFFHFWTYLVLIPSSSGYLLPFWKVGLGSLSSFSLLGKLKITFSNIRNNNNNIPQY